MINQSRLKQLLNYDPNTGIFTWKIKGRKKIVGCINFKTGYLVIRIDNKLYQAHRLVFLYMTGDIPEYVDHIDCNKLNNKWSNLRKATKSQNEMNKPKKITNKTGFKGVVFVKARSHLKTPWKAQITCNRKQIALGYFETAELAANAYNKAALNLFQEYANLNKGE